jgi:hypothetical protein
MDVIGHYHKSVQIETVKGLLAVPNCGNDRFRDARILEPKRTGAGAIEFAVDCAKLFSGISSSGFPEFLRESRRQRTLETPGNENAFACGLLGRKVSGGVAHVVSPIGGYLKRKAHRHECLCYLKAGHQNAREGVIAN